MSGSFAYLINRNEQPDACDDPVSSAPQTQRPTDAGWQYGRRVDPTYAQLNANIPAELRRQLRVRLASEERKRQDVLDALIRGCLDGRFKV